jgi:hypothetical protein
MGFYKETYNYVLVPGPDIIEIICPNCKESITIELDGDGTVHAVSSCDECHADITVSAKLTIVGMAR